MLPTAEIARGRVLVSTHFDREDERVSGEIDFRANEGLIVDVEE